MSAPERQIVALPSSPREQPMNESSQFATLRRIAVESAEHVRKSRISCDATDDHIKSSRAAISRSLVVLTLTSTRLID